MFIEGKRKRKGIAYRIVKIYRYKVPSRNRTYNIIYKSTTSSIWLCMFFLKNAGKTLRRFEMPRNNFGT
jgi:hypothetical protein